MGIDCNSTIPVQSDESPSQRSRDGWDMDCSSVGIVAEVEEGEVEEVDDQDDLGPDEVAADEEHDPGELEEVVEDEVASDGGCGLDVVAVLGEEVPQVGDLGEEEGEPGM